MFVNKHFVNKLYGQITWEFLGFKKDSKYDIFRVLVLYEYEHIERL